MGSVTTRCLNVNCGTEPLSTASTTAVEQKLNDDIVPDSIQTISTTLADTGASLSIQPIPSMMQAVSPLPDQTPDKMLSRLMELGTLTWSVGDPATVTGPPRWKLNPFTALSTLPVFEDILQWYLYMRSDVEISFRINTNQFYAGALMITSCPGDLVINSGTDAPAGIQTRSYLPTVVLSAQKQDTATIHLPWAWNQRFISITDVQAMDPFIMWSVYVDILSPLVATVSSPLAVSVAVMARFMNPKLFLPFVFTSSGKASEKPARPKTILEPRRMAITKTVHHQSSATTKKFAVPQKKGVRSVVHVAAPASDPLESTGDTVPTSTSLPGTVLSAIGDIPSAIGAVTNLVNPIMSVVDSFAGLLDKPEIVEHVTRVYQTPAANMCLADVPDQSLPLSLYKGSYLTVDPTAIPGGRHWTLLDIASTPTLGFQWTFNNPGSSPLRDTTVLPYLPPGTAVHTVCTTHTYWRGSVRMHVKFFCSSFISARILFVISPSASTLTTDTIANNLTRLVDVKGDTTTSFTMPFVWPWDYSTFDPDNGIIPPYKIQASVFNDIVTNDVTVQPSIDMVVWYAAGPDFQWSGLTGDVDVIDYSYPNNPSSLARRIRDRKNRRIAKKSLSKALTSPDSTFHLVQKQASIQEEFKVSFQPFIQDCEYLTDSHHVTSESTLYVTDILKRYQRFQPILDPETGNTTIYDLPITYSPYQNTVGYFFTRFFLFSRGGMRYKFLDQDNQNYYTTWGSLNSGNGGSIPSAWSGSPNGQAMYTFTTSDSIEFSITVPWIGNVPFMSDKIAMGTSPLNAAQGASITASNLSPLTSGQWTTAVRDDYTLGYLIAPDWTT